MKVLTKNANANRILFYGKYHKTKNEIYARN